MDQLNYKILKMLDTHNNSECPRDLVGFLCKLKKECGQITGCSDDLYFVHSRLVSLYNDRSIKLSVLQRNNLLEIILYRIIKLGKIAKIKFIQKEINKLIKVSSADVKYAIGELVRKNECNIVDGYEIIGN